MRRRLIRAAILPAVLAAGLAGGGCQGPPATGDPIEAAWADLAWLAGEWSGEQDGVTTEEHWTAPRGDTMLGVNRTTRAGRTIFFEFLRIDRDDMGFVYHASPRGRFPPTPFRRIDETASPLERLVFENPAHDFPRRIVYELRPDGALLQRIEGTADGEPRATGWVLRRVSGG